jgi:hypothetical protein
MSANSTAMERGGGNWVVEATHAGSLALFQEVQLLRVTEHDFSCPIARQKYPTHPHAHAEATHIFRFHAAAECGGGRGPNPSGTDRHFGKHPSSKAAGQRWDTLQGFGFVYYHPSYFAHRA